MDVIGGVFVLWGVIAILRNIVLGRYDQLLWACWIGLIIIGIGALKRNASLTASQLNILALPWLAWSLDFIYEVITRQPLWGITSYIFENRYPIDTAITSAHLLALPATLYILAILKISKKDAYKLSFIHLFGLFALTILLTPYAPDNGINCVYKSCIPIPQVLPFPFQWALTGSLMILITNRVLIKMFRPEEDEVHLRN